LNGVSLVFHVTERKPDADILPRSEFFRLQVRNHSHIDRLFDGDRYPMNVRMNAHLQG
jgi:hypothetical protein